MPNLNLKSSRLPIRQQKWGSSLLLVLFILVFLSLLISQYLLTTRTGQSTSFHFEQSDKLRLIAESASDEMIQELAVKCCDFRSPAGQWLMKHVIGETFPLNVSVTEKELNGSVRGDFISKITGEAKIFDFRGFDQDKNSYYKGEGVGRILLTTLVSRNTGSQNESRFCRLVRIHDFKISSAISARNNFEPRKGYVHNFLLDYVFFLKDGIKNFWENGEGLLNPGLPKILINQEKISSSDKLGKVFLGNPTGVAGQDYVFLNIPPEFAEILPKISSNLPNKSGKRVIDSADCLKLIPELAKLNVGGILDKLKGVFEYSFEPIADQYSDADGKKKSETVKILKNVSKNSVESNTNPGTPILSFDPNLAAKPERALSILEGPIRQRFLCFVHFYLDMSEVDPRLASEMEKREDFKIPCTPPDPSQQTEPEVKRFLENLQEFAQERSRPQELNPFISHFETGFLYQGEEGENQFLNPPTFPLPQFFDYQNHRVDFQPGATHPPRSFPYNHINLLTRRHWNVQALESQGIFDRANGILNLHGIDEVWEPLVLGEDGGKPLIIRGQGVLIANGSITLRSGLKKENPGDFCVLFAKKDSLIIATDQRIEGALLALGLPGKGIIVQKGTGHFDIFGLIAADSLRFEEPDSHESSISYDPIFKSQNDQFWINISPKIYFQRMVEG
ncbi:MAG: hypothetical protein HQM08_14260 [Candidatus Riflebacteria bacterium]|nr:hypothetical protein [Candidatus Riflebacteria bacterium]